MIGRGLVAAALLVLAGAASGFDVDDGYPQYPGVNQRISPNAQTPVRHEKIVAGLSRDAVAITASFDGSDILIYGAVKRDMPAPATPLQVIVTVEGPSEALTIRRKERRFGIWVNASAVSVGAAPGFYSVTTTGPLRQILSPAADTRYRISVPLAMRAFAGAPTAQDVPAFTEALIRDRIRQGLYRLDEGSVALVDDTLFRADVRLPANLVEGSYKTRIFLVRGGEVIDTYRAAIDVRKVGLERWLYRLAFDQPLVYGLLSLAIAVIAGWGASALMRLLRPG
ncbi:TIGR02186 family protein [Paracoccus jiaweipingae]|uniref:TIGR02186 family protein n=1 Tax=unclassified Paracoccus (in: a-proteobacteria) TaxID=2688777 RepID=UPI0037A45396